MRSTILALSTLLTTPAFAQSPAIPAPVIEECNETAQASELPTCLKEGAIAFELLDTARSDDFYGPAAEPVLDICAERNETFSGQWTCFENAVGKAAETRDLIGLENIADACVAGISDPGNAARIMAEHRERRAQRFPGEMYFGGGAYYPFAGCPAPVEEAGSDDSSAAEDAGDDAVDTAGDDTVDAAGEEDMFSTSACSAYGEIETIIRTSDPDRLRIMWAEMTALGEPDAAQMSSATGLSKDAAAFILAAREQQAITTGTLLGAFVETSHPALLDEALSQDQTLIENPAAELGSAMARQMFSSVLAVARQKYEASCAADKTTGASGSLAQTSKPQDDSKASGPPLTLGERESFRLAVRQCWQVDVGSEAANVSVTIRFDMTEYARVVSNSLEQVSTSGGSDAAIRSAYERGRRAILRCQNEVSGYDLPPEKYEQWREMTVRFGPTDIRLQ